MSVYIIRAVFDFYLVFKATGSQGDYFRTKLLQDIFYLIWDLPIVLPPVVMHYLNYRPQFKMDKAVAAPDRAETLVENDYSQNLEESSKRPILTSEIDF